MLAKVLPLPETDTKLEQKPNDAGLECSKLPREVSGVGWWGVRMDRQACQTTAAA